MGAALAKALRACGVAASLVSCEAARELDVGATAGFGRCQQLRAEALPAGTSVVFVLNDAMRRDRPGVYGGSARTPRFDAFARGHFLFRRAVSTAPWTKPAVASLFTSLYPSQHGVNWHPHQKLGDESGRLALRDRRALAETEVLDPAFETLAEALRGAGVRTGAFVANPWLARIVGFDQGFEAYDDSFAGWDAPAGAVTRAGLAWLDRLDPGERFFLYLHYVDSHLPYGRLHPEDLEAQRERFAEDRRPIPEEALGYLGIVRLGGGRLLLAPGLDPALGMLELAYDRGVEDFDRSLGDLLDQLERRPDWPRLAVVVTSDHGEALFERGWGNHGRSLHREEIAIPLAARLPGVEADGFEIDCPASLVDLGPTICEVLGAECPKMFAGTSLLAPAEPRPPDTASARFLVSEGPAVGPDGQPNLLRRAVQNRRFKLVLRPGVRLGEDPQGSRDGGDYALYDLVADPGERQDLLDGWLRPRGTDRVAAALKQALETAVPPYRRPVRRTVTLDAKQSNRLRALGYLPELEEMPSDRASPAPAGPSRAGSPD